MLLLNKKGALQPFNPNDFGLVGVPTVKAGILLNSVATLSGQSKAEIRRKISQGAVWVGDEKATDPLEDLIGGNVAVTIFVGKSMVGVLLP